MKTIHAQRLTAQLLAGEPARDPVAVAERLLAIQGQDGRGARLAVRARTTGLTAADVDAALTDDRSLLITWLNRGTLHLVRSEDYAWLHALTTPPLQTGSLRRLAQEGVTPAATERGVKLIVRAVADDGPQTRAQLKALLDTAGVRTERQALVHILMQASLRGLIVRGPMAGRQHAYVLVEDWLGKQPRVDRGKALAELARRYLAGHGPASDRDLARWAGLPLRDARAGLGAIAGELAEVADGLVDLAARGAPAPVPPPRLLGAYEPLLLGWCSRDDVLGGNVGIVTVNGLFHPIALAGGRAVGTWAMPGGDVELKPFGRLAAGVRKALEADARAVEGFFSAAGPG